MIKIPDALNQILESISPLGLEKVNILEAQGRILGEDIYSGRNIPPRDNSAMDGFVLRCADTRGAAKTQPAVFKIIEDIPAGYTPQKILTERCAARIMTGAPIPGGGDAVVRKEDVAVEGSELFVFAEVPEGRDIRRAGEDVTAGELVIPRGEVVRPAEIGMMASLGRSFVYVFQQPLVAVIATGNELSDLDEPPSEFSIVNSNSYSLAAQVRDCGGRALMLGLARDTREDVYAKFEAALRADVIISSGGVSVGDYDLVKEVMQEAGNQMRFWQVAMKPGKPFAFGFLQGKPLFGLPGNPVSSMISFEQFVRPALLKMMGHRRIFRKLIKATLLEDIKKKPGLTHLIRAQITLEDREYRAGTTGEQGSGILKSMVRANGLIVLPETIATAKKGEEVMVMLLDSSLDQTEKPA